MNEERLQELLSVYRSTRRMPVLPRRHSPGRWWLAAAAAIAVAIVIAWPRPRGAWIAEEAGRRRVLQVGESIATGPGMHARLESNAIGVIDIGPRTEIRLVEVRAKRQRLALASGTIHAKTTSPPGVFVVDTPRAAAMDLGCEYVLSVAPDGHGLLRVTSGWVELTRGWTQSLVPQGAHAWIEDGHLSPPVFDDAPPAFQAAVRSGDLPTVLRLSRRRDALTLINLFRDATPDQRLQIYDRLDVLVPAPPSIPREAMGEWTIHTLDAWWPPVMKASGVSAIKKK